MMYLMLVAVLFGTLYGLAFPVTLEQSSVLGGLFSLGGVFAGLAIALVGYLAWQQHAETELHATEMAGLLYGYYLQQDHKDLAAEAFTQLASRFQHGFGGTTPKWPPVGLEKLAAQLPGSEAGTLLSTWFRLESIAHRRVYPTLWWVMSAFLLWGSAATAALAIPLFYKLVLNAVVAVFAALVVDADDPFTGLYVIKKNPFILQEKPQRGS